MNDVTFPGGQPYTPPRELAEEELEEICQFLKELKKKKSEEGEEDDK